MFASINFRKFIQTKNQSINIPVCAHIYTYICNMMDVCEKRVPSRFDYGFDLHTAYIRVYFESVGMKIFRERTFLLYFWVKGHIIVSRGMA